MLAAKLKLATCRHQYMPTSKSAQAQRRFELVREQFPLWMRACFCFWPLSTHQHTHQSQSGRQPWQRSALIRHAHDRDSICHKCHNDSDECIRPLHRPAPPSIIAHCNCAASIPIAARIWCAEAIGYRLSECTHASTSTFGCRSRRALALPVAARTQPPPIHAGRAPHGGAGAHKLQRRHPAPLFISDGNRAGRAGHLAGPADQSLACPAGPGSRPARPCGRLAGHTLPAADVSLARAPRRHRAAADGNRRPARDRRARRRRGPRLAIRRLCIRHPRCRCRRSWRWLEMHRLALLSRPLLPPPAHSPAVPVANPSPP
eukprot:scaffold1669_cov108-Isochrysis_galbana.AAC.2